MGRPALRGAPTLGPQAAPVGLATQSDRPLNVLLDTNVVLDIILAREPFVQKALLLFAMGEAGEIQLFLSTDAISTIYYIVERNKDAKTARQAIVNLIGRVRLATLDERSVLRGIDLDFVDIEDALVAAVAEAAHVDLIATRNGRDFANSPIPAVSPDEFLAFWQARGKGSAKGGA